MKKYLLLLPVWLLGVLSSATGQVPTIYKYVPDISVCRNSWSFDTLYVGGAVTYEWQLSDQDGEIWNDVSGNPLFSGATTNVLGIYGDLSLQSHLLRCIVSNASGPTTSPRTYIQVDTIPPHTTLNTPVTSVCIGSIQVYSLSGTTPADTLLWYIPGGAENYAPDIRDSATDIMFFYGPSLTLSAAARNGCGTGDTSSFIVTVNAPSATLAGTPGGSPSCTLSAMIPDAQVAIADNSCNTISQVFDNGNYGAESYMQSCVQVDNSVQSFNGIPYVQRHYTLEPFYSSNSPYVTVTLYFTQSDFDNYNAARGANPALPAGPSDAAGISNLRITQFHGTGTTPATYVSGSGTIDPDDNNIVWNSSASRWEVTFNITSFSGFFVSGSPIIPLPLTLMDFEGQSTPEGNLLKWTTTMEENTRDFELQRSAVSTTTGAAGSNNVGSFQTIANLPAAGNSDHTINYAYTDALNTDTAQAFAYRLRMVDLDGKFTYSQIVLIQRPVPGLSVKILPNPFHDPISINVYSPSSGNALLNVTDLSGRVITQQTVLLHNGANSLDPSLLNALAKGMYLMTISTSTQKITTKLIKN